VSERRRRRETVNPSPGFGAALLVLAACSTAPDTKTDLLRYQRALETAVTDPAAAWDACSTVADAGLRGDCGLATIEAWAGHKGVDSAELLSRCAELEPQTTTHECAFQVAERRHEPAGCAAAGPYEDDCRLHLATARFDAWMPRDARLQDEDLHQQMITEAEEAGLAADDPRVWSAFFRRVYMQQISMDRSGCTALIEFLAESCHETGRAVYRDRMNIARTQGMFPCDDAEPPRFLQTGDDTELEQLRRLEQRWKCGKARVP